MPKRRLGRSMALFEAEARVPIRRPRILLGVPRPSLSPSCLSHARNRTRYVPALRRSWVSDHAAFRRPRAMSVRAPCEIPLREIVGAVYGGSRFPCRREPDVRRAGSAGVEATLGPVRYQANGDQRLSAVDPGGDVSCARYRVPHCGRGRELRAELRGLLVGEARRVERDDRPCLPHDRRRGALDIGERSIRER